MYVVEILVPVFDAQGRAFSKTDFDGVRTELMEKFGGVTAFQRSPAMGLWQDDAGEIRRDDIAIFEVMTPTLDTEWWAGYRRRLEKRFEQETMVVRASVIEML